MPDIHKNKKLTAEYLTCQRFLKKLEYLHTQHSHHRTRRPMGQLHTHNTATREPVGPWVSCTHATQPPQNP